MKYLTKKKRMKYWYSYTMDVAQKRKLSERSHLVYNTICWIVQNRQSLFLCWSSHTLASWYEEMTHWKRPWCWERRWGRQRMRRLDSITDSMDMNLIMLWEIVEGEEESGVIHFMALQRVDWGTSYATVHGVAKSQTRMSDFTFTSNWTAIGKTMETESILGVASDWGLRGLRRWLKDSSFLSLCCENVLKLKVMAVVRLSEYSRNHWPV